MSASFLMALAVLATLCSGCRAARAGDAYEGFGTVTTLFAIPERQPDWPAGTITGSGFHPDPDEQGNAPATRAMLLADEIDQVDAVTRRLEPGRRAWIKGQVFEQFIRVDEIEVLPFKGAAAIPDKTTNEIGRFMITETGAWHNRMPPSMDRRHLVITIRADEIAPSDEPRTVKVERVFYSFDKDREGQPARQMALIDASTGLTGKALEMTLSSEKPTDIALRGENVYPPGHVNEEIFLIVVLSVGEERIILRGHTQIIAAV